MEDGAHNLPSQTGVCHVHRTTRHSAHPDYISRARHSNDVSWVLRNLVDHCRMPGVIRCGHSGHDGCRNRRPLDLFRWLVSELDQRPTPAGRTTRSIAAGAGAHVSQHRHCTMGRYCSADHHIERARSRRVAASRHHEHRRLALLAAGEAISRVQG
jgi:hypothetical protein